MKYEINVSEAMRYLGCAAFDGDMRRLADTCCDELMKVLTPRWTYVIFDISSDESGVKFLNSNFFWKSSDVACLLKKSQKCVLLAATLGVEADRLIARLQKTDLSRGVVLDACASAAIEAVCNAASDEIKRQHNVKYLTRRFSPGYGDFDIKHQTDFIRLTDAYKKIGLTASSSMLLTPIKSVTAVMGITDSPYLTAWGSCEECADSGDCKFRKKGLTCKDDR